MSRVKTGILASLLLLSTWAQAVIVIGQSAPLTGVTGEYGRNMTQGAQAYFSWINKQPNGLNGDQVKYVLYDDGFDFTRTLANTKKLTTEDNAVALMGYFSADATASIISRRWLDGAGIALVGLTNTSKTVREPGSKYFFNTRASQREEIAKLISQMKRLGITHMGVFYQDDVFGNDGLAAAQEEARAQGVGILASASFPANTVSVTTAAKRLAERNPPAILMISSTKPSAEFIKAFRRLDSDAQIYHTSTVDFDQLVKEIGPDMVHGIAIAQVFPFPYDDQNKLIREFRSAMATFALPTAKAGYAALEGYVTAKLVCDAIAKAGKEPTRAKVLEALEAMGEVNYGGFRVSYSGGQRSGSHFVELTVANQKGELQR